MTINFDMDGTIADLYGVNDWLPKLVNHIETPYIEAKPLLPFNLLARRLNALQKRGYKIVVISWLAKGSDEEYDEKVSNAKLRWLAQHLPSVKWDNINIVPYGTPKNTFCETTLDILFDDETKNREEWTGKAYNEKNILETLKNLLTK